MSVVPMYMPGRRRTASSPSRTWMSFALYEAGGLLPFPARLFSPFLVFTPSSPFLTATCSPLCATGADQELIETLEVLVGVVIDRDATTLAAAQDLHLRTQRSAQLARHLREIWIAAAQTRSRAPAPRSVDHLSRERLSVAHRELPRDHCRERGQCVRKR